MVCLYQLGARPRKFLNTAEDILLMNIFTPGNLIDDSNIESKYFIIFKSKLLHFFKESSVRPFTEDEMKWAGLNEQSRHFIGYLNGAPLYAVSVIDNQTLIPDTKFTDLRSLFPVMNMDLFEALSRAFQIVTWSDSNKYCGVCGEKLQEDNKERAMKCTTCKAPLVYPRISPCIITLIYNKESILLAHNKNFPTNLYSTIAGFIEAGESAEDCLKREVKEEVGIGIKNIEYFKSQSWPFPGQLMLGYFAEYESGEISPDNSEIDDAQWFEKNNLPNVPPPGISISGDLIEHYLNKIK